MPFDLATARPAGAPASGGFDLSTARPASGGGPNSGRRHVTQAERQDQARDKMYRDSMAYAGGAAKASRNVFGAVAALPETVASAVTGGVGAAAGGAAGMGAAAINPYARLFGFEPTAPEDVVSSVQGALTYQPVTESGQRLTAGAMYPLEKLAEGADVAGDFTSRVTGSPLAGAAVNTAIQSIPALLGRGRVGNVRSVPAPARAAPAAAEVAPLKPAARPVPASPAQAQRPAGLERLGEKAPTKEQLRQASQDAYQRATDAGVVVNESGTASLKQSIQKAIADDYDADLHPHVRAILKRVEATEGKLTLDQIEKLRRFASKQEGAAYRTIGGEDSARIAGSIVDEIDDFTDGSMAKFTSSGDAATGAQALTDARNLYSRNRKAQQLEDMMESAKERAGQFSVSGMENAIRTEFRQLARNKKRMARFTKQEQAAIQSIARGTNTVNALRWLGKLAPTGQMSQFAWLMSSIATGGAAAAIPALGLGARAGAGRMQVNAVNRLSEMARAGGPGAAPLRRNALTKEYATNE